LKKWDGKAQYLEKATIKNGHLVVLSVRFSKKGNLAENFGVYKFLLTVF